MFRNTEIYKAFTITFKFKDKHPESSVFTPHKIASVEAFLAPNKSFGRTETVVFKAKNIREVKAMIRDFWSKK